MKNVYNGLFYFGLLFWLIESTYFGWHATSQSGAESVCDLIATVTLMIGMIGSIAISAVDRYLKDKGL
jgi:hypothetical protein